MSHSLISALFLSSKDIHDLSLYKRMVGFVMSYSFTDHESNETLMVPVGDIFNHHTNNNAQLSFDDESLLRMISTKPIKKVQNTLFFISCYDASCHVAFLSAHLSHIIALRSGISRGDEKFLKMK